MIEPNRIHAFAATVATYMPALVLVCAVLTTIVVLACAAYIPFRKPKSVGEASTTPARRKPTVPASQARA